MSAFIAGEQKSSGKSITVSTLRSKYVVLKESYFPKLLETAIPQEDKDGIVELLRKPWNPYIRRHTGLTEKSLKIPGLMNQYAGWTEGSKMSQKYFHYFGNESSNGLLQAYGILPKDKQESEILKPKQCPNCNEPNKPDSKFCAKCRMVLTYDGYSGNFGRLEGKRRQGARIMEEQFNSMQSQMQSHITVLGSMDSVNQKHIRKTTV